MGSYTFFLLNLIIFIPSAFKIEKLKSNINIKNIMCYFQGWKKGEDMKKKAKSVELVTAPLTWCDSTRAKWRKEGRRGR